MRKARVFALVALLSSALPLIGSAGTTTDKWIPDSWGLPPFAGNAAGFTGGNAIAHITRRIAPDPSVPGRFMLGHALYGLYTSASGGGWVSQSPHCLNLARWVDPATFQSVEDALHLLGGCGVEGIAFDSTNPLSMYATTYNFKLVTSPSVAALIEPGGIYRGVLKVGSTDLNTGGLLWTNLLPGVRGNAIAVRPVAGGPHIAVGRIQRYDGGPLGGADPGLDNNTTCNAYTGALPSGVPKCSPSLYISYNGGTTWAPKYFNPAAAGNPCANGSNITGSSKLVGNIVFDPTTPSVMYAGANSGFWLSTDSGATWTSPVPSCGAAPGIAVTTGGTPGTQRLYVGLSTGEIKVASTGSATGPGAFTTLVAPGYPTGTGPIKGKILSILLDANDPSQRTMFVAAWESQPRPASSTVGGVYKVVDNGNGTATVTDFTGSLLDPLRPQLDPVANLLPYPLFFNHPLTKTTLFLAQHPLAPDLLYVSTVWGGVWVKHSNPSL